MVLEDDKHYFPPYDAVPLVRDAVVMRHPEVREALRELGGKISEEQMRKMNYAVDGEHKDAKEVVREFLSSLARPVAATKLKGFGGPRAVSVQLSAVSF